MSTLSPPVLHRLDLACKHIRDVFGGFNGPYLVGSVQERTAGPGSDVDLRLILDERPPPERAWQGDARPTREVQP